MIGALAIATSLLAIFEDDVDLEELYQRAVLLKRPEIITEALTDEQLTVLYDHLENWVREANSLHEQIIRITKAAFFMLPTVIDKRFVEKSLPTFGGNRVFGVFLDGLEGLDGHTELKKYLNIVEDPKIDILNMEEIQEMHGMDEIISWSPKQILLAYVHYDNDEDQGIHLLTIQRTDPEGIRLVRKEAITAIKKLLPKAES